MKILLFVTTLFIANVLNAQIATHDEVGERSFQILKSLSTKTEQQFVSDFLPAMKLYNRISEEKVTDDVYKENYYNLKSEGIAWEDISFIEFNKGIADANLVQDVQGYTGGNIVFKCKDKKHYVKIVYMYYRHNYYLLRIYDRVRLYPF